MDSVEKQQLTDFVRGELPPLLAEHGGILRKFDARNVINRAFRRLHGGWPAALERPGEHGVKQWLNAYGHALRQLEIAGITEISTGSQLYRLKGKPVPEDIGSVPFILGRPSITPARRTPNTVYAMSSKCWGE